MNPAKIGSLTIGYLMLLWSLTAPAQGTVVYEHASITGGGKPGFVTK